MTYDTRSLFLSPSKRYFSEFGVALDDASARCMFEYRAQTLADRWANTLRQRDAVIAAYAKAMYQGRGEAVALRAGRMAALQAA